MEINLLTLCYLLGSVSFIVGLKMLSHPDTARKGNWVAAAGMAIAILGTIFYTVKMESNSKTMDGFLAGWQWEQLLEL